MKKIMKIILLLSSLGLISCYQDNGSGQVLSKRYIHKYGFDISQEEWESRKQDGSIVITLENNVTKEEHYSHGVLQGATTSTYPNSSIIAHTDIYDDGNLLKTIQHDLEGFPYKEKVYEFDNREIITLWDKNGVPMSIEEYQDQRLIKGKYFTQKHTLEATIENGKGERIKRSRDGLLLSKDRFDNGQVVHRTLFHANGQVQSEASFDNYVLHGKQTTFSPESNPLVEMFWEHGRLDGIKKVYKNGKVVLEVPYTLGQKHGIEKAWNDEGMLITEIHWQNDLRHGSSRYYGAEDTIINWYYLGKAVGLQEYRMMEFREQMIAELQGNDYKIEKGSTH